MSTTSRSGALSERTSTRATGTSGSRSLTRVSSPSRTSNVFCSTPHAAPVRWPPSLRAATSTSACGSFSASLAGIHRVTALPSFAEASGVSSGFSWITLRGPRPIESSAAPFARVSTGSSSATAAIVVTSWSGSSICRRIANRTRPGSPDRRRTSRTVALSARVVICTGPRSGTSSGTVSGCCFRSSSISAFARSSGTITWTSAWRFAAAGRAVSASRTEATSLQRDPHPPSSVSTSPRSSARPMVRRYVVADGNAWQTSA